MKKALTITAIITITILIASTYNYVKLSKTIDEGLREYAPEKTLKTTKNKHPIIITYARDSTPKSFLNFLYYYLKENIPYNYERANDPEILLERGGDCYDFTYYIIGLYVALYRDADVYLLIMNIKTDTGTTGHVAPLFRISNEYILIDVATGHLETVKNIDAALDFYNTKKTAVFHIVFDDGKLVEKSLVLRF